MDFKYYFVLFCLSLFLSEINAQIKNIEITYEQAIEDSNGNYKVLGGLEYSLVANKSASRFERIKSVRNEAFNSNERYMFLANASGVFYSNKKENLHQIEINNKVYLIIMDNFNSNWEITAENKYIAGYKCYKAIYTQKTYDELSKRETTTKTFAWFTPEIPISFGPTHFNGLPGLILQVKPYDGKIYFTAKEIRETQKAIKRPVLGIEITEEELIELFSNTFEEVNAARKKLRKEKSN